MEGRRQILYNQGIAKGEDKVMKWSEKQSLAIEERGKNILVSAAAGSGKTAVLVERIKQLMLKDKMDIDRMLILTFTNAAAGEMRERIYKVLSDELSQGNDGAERFLNKQLDLIYLANISTFHSFCIEVLRKNFYAINLEPNFKICDEAQKSILENEAFNELLEKKFEENHTLFIGLLDRYCNEKSYNGIKDMIMETYTFIQSIPNPLSWLKESIEKMNTDEKDFIESDLFTQYKKGLILELRKIEDVTERAICIANSPQGPYFYAEALKDDLQQVADFKKKLRDNDFESLCNNKVSWMRLPAKKDDSVTEASKTMVKKLREEVKNTIKNIEKTFASKTIAEYVEDLTHVYPYAKELLHMVEEFHEIFMEKKREKNLLDFNDLEHLTIQLLEDKSIADTYRRKYQYIFVDEYQDSNIVQETIINSIKRSDNLFMVGDVKQSIYRFRLADPGLFIKKYEAYKEDQGLTNLKIDLNQNFRSKDLIINGINYLFSQLMKKDLGDLEYDKDAYLYKGISYDKRYDSPIEVAIIEHNEKNPTMDEAIKDMMKAEVEALKVGERIEALIDTVIFDTKIGAERKVRYSDIVILLRTVKGWAPIYEEVLGKKNIPIYVDSSESFFETIEIGIILNLIELTNNKKQDIPLLSIMRSPIGEFTTEEIVNIRLFDKNVKFFKALEGYILWGENRILAEKCNDFMLQVERWQKYSTYMRVDDLLWKILQETGFYLYISALPGYGKRQGNILSLLEKAKQFEDTHRGGLVQFLKFIEESKKFGFDINVAKVIDQNENIVKLMSIHKSKGLEFPIVILGGLGKMINKRSASTSKVIFNREIGIGMRYVEPEINAYTETWIEKVIKKRHEKEMMEEELRILYVAMTRAKDMLICVGTVPDIEKAFVRWQVKDEDFVYEANNYLDFIMPLLVKHKDCGKYFQELEEEIVVMDYKDPENSQWEIHMISSSSIEEKVKQQKSAKEKIKKLFFSGWDVGPSQEIEDKLNWQYPYKSAYKLPSKMTVTEVRRLLSKEVIFEEMDMPMRTPEPLFVADSHQYTAMEKGIFIHKVMQHIHIHQTDGLEQIKEQMREMIKKEILRQEEADIVDIPSILQFFDSAIGRRMKNSQEVYREIPFNLRKPANQIMNQHAISQDDIMVQGTIDCYFKEKDGYVLIDYKSDFISTIKGKTIQDVQEKYAIQLALYKEALEDIKNIKVKEVYLYLFSIGKSIKIH